MAASRENWSELFDDRPATGSRRLRPITIKDARASRIVKTTSGYQVLDFAPNGYLAIGNTLLEDMK